MEYEGMNINQIKEKARRDFDIVFAIIGIIPTLGFFYIITVKFMSFHVMTEDVSMILFWLLSMTVIGILTGRRIMKYLLDEIVLYHKRVEKLQKKLIKEERIKAITETAVTLSHEINNPLAIVAGKLYLYENKPEKITAEEIALLMEQCNRIQEVTAKMSKVMQPISTEYTGDIKMIDIKKSS